MGTSDSFVAGYLIVVAEPACHAWLQFVVCHEIAHVVNSRVGIVQPMVGHWYEHQMDATAASILAFFAL